MPRICSHQAARSMPMSMGTDREGPRLGIVIHFLKLKLVIGRVHGKEKDHQYQFYVQDPVRVFLWPAFHLGLNKAADPDDIPAKPENHHGKDHQQGQDFK